jgi:O-antigen/teichoic acid export membrane protein
MSTAAPVPADGRAEIRGSRTVLSDYLSLIGGRGSAVVVALLSVLVTTKLLGSEGYGRLNYLLVGSLLIFNIAASWTAPGVLKQGREEVDASGRMGLTTWARLGIVGPLALAMAAVLLVARFAFGLYGGYGATAIALALGYAVVLMLVDHCMYSLEAQGRIKVSAAMQVVARGLPVVGVAGLLVLERSSGVTEVMAVWVGAGLVGAALMLVTLGSAGLRPVRFDRERLHELWRFSLPLLLTTISAFGISWCDIIVIKIFGTFRDVGQYALAYRGYEALLQVTTASISVITPLIVSMRGGARQDLLRLYHSRAVPQLTALSALLLGLLAAPAYVMLPAIFGHEFADASRPMLLLIASLHAYAVATLLMPVLFAFNRTKAVGWTTVAAVIANIAIDVALVPAIGIVGAGIATLAGNLVIAGGIAVRAAREVGEPVARWQLASLPLLAGALPVYVVPSLAGYLASPVAALAAFLLLVRVGRLITAEDEPLFARLRIPAPVRRVLLRAGGVAA